MHIRPSTRPRNSADDIFEPHTRRPTQRRRLTLKSTAIDPTVASPSPSPPFSSPAAQDTPDRAPVTQPTRPDRWPAAFVLRTRSLAFQRDERSGRRHRRAPHSRSGAGGKHDRRDGNEQHHPRLLTPFDGTALPPTLTLQLCDDYTEIMSGPWSARDGVDARDPVRRASSSVNDLYGAVDGHQPYGGAIHSAQLPSRGLLEDGAGPGMQSALESDLQSPRAQPELASHTHVNGTVSNPAQPRSVLMSRPPGTVKDIASRFDQNSPEQSANRAPPSYQFDHQRHRKPVGLREARPRSPHNGEYTSANLGKRVPLRSRPPPEPEASSFETLSHDTVTSEAIGVPRHSEREMTELEPHRPLFGEVTASGWHAYHAPSHDAQQEQNGGRRHEHHRANRRQSEGSSMRKGHGDSLFSPASQPTSRQNLNHRHSRSDLEGSRPQLTPSMPNLTLSSTLDQSLGHPPFPPNPSSSNTSQIPVSSIYLHSPPPSKTPPPRSSSASAVHRIPRSAKSPSHKKVVSPKENAVPLPTTRGRYQPPPLHSLQSQQTLSARIVPPLPKTSPPLRSSRPRQPVSSATTAASRARVADRFDGTSTKDGRMPSEQWLGQPLAGTKEIPRRRIPELDKVDFAARRARIQKAISQNLSETHSTESLKGPAHGSLASSAVHRVPSLGGPELGERDFSSSSADVANGVPQTLSVNTTDIDRSHDHEPQTAHTAFDEESPIIPINNNDLPEAQPAYGEEYLTSATYQLPVIESGAFSMSSTFNPSREQLNSHDANASDGDTEFAEDNSGEDSPSDIEDRWGLHDGLKSGQGSIRIMLGGETMQYDDANNNCAFDEPPSLHAGAEVPLENDVPSGRRSVHSSQDDTLKANDFHMGSDQAIANDDTTSESELARLLDQYHKDGQIPPALLLCVQSHMVDLNRISANGGSDGFMVQNLLDSVLQSQQEEQTTPTEAPQPAPYSIPAVTPDTPPDALAARGTAVLYQPEPNEFQLEPEDDFETSIRKADEEWERQRREDQSLADFYHDDRPPPPPKDLGYTTRSSISMVVSPIDSDGRRISTAADISRPESPVLGSNIMDTTVGDDTSDSMPPKPGYTPPIPPARQETLTNDIPPPIEVVAIPGSIHSAEVPATFQPSSMSHALREAAPALPSSVSVSSLTATSTRQSSLDRASENRSKSDQNLPISPSQKRLQKRQHIIRELLDTENTYHQDLKIIEDIYKATVGDMVTHEDKKILFGNCDEVERFSLHFYDELRRAVASVYTPSKKLMWGQKRSSFSTTRSDGTGQTSLAPSGNTSESVDDEKDRATTVGQTFLNNLQDMDHVYGAYLRNHDAANQRLSALKKDPTVKCWLDECHNNASDITSAWDLDSLLVKPTQRISKYPMLLQQLLDTTPSSHPDHNALKGAAKESVTMLTRINEAKKRAELVDQIINRKAKDDVRSGLAKAFGRRTEKLKERVGIAEAFQDTDFDEIVHKFGGHYIRLQICMRDVQDYVHRIDKAMDQINNYAASLEAYTDVAPSSLPEVESKWRRYGQAIREITGVAFPDHKAAVQRRVIQPMVKCIELHKGPQNAINQRKKRIVDYAKCKSIEKRGEKPDKKTIEASDMYVALNDHLKLELPRLYNLTASLVQHCLTCFLDIQLSWFNVWERKLRPTIDAIDIPASISHIEPAFRPDYNLVKEKMAEIALCNGSMLAEASSMLSSATTLVDSDTSRKRPSTTIDGRSDRTMSMTSDSSPNIGIGGWKRYSSGYGSGQELPLSSTDGRIRSNSSYSNRGASWQSSGPVATSPAAWPAGGAVSAASSRPVTANAHHGYPQPPSRASSDMPRSSRPSSSSVPMRLDVPEDHRYSGMFSSALPADMLEPNHPTVPRHAPDDMPVLFVCASLFEFSIDRTRKEAGYPYLTYVRGEVFDVVAQKGELWLAKNQDDDSNSLGWIWEQHFVILSNE